MTLTQGGAMLRFAHVDAGSLDGTDARLIVPIRIGGAASAAP
ncbi:MAG: hypothetical protein WCS43_02895 [Verrucomicrobiota bacterium]